VAVRSTEVLGDDDARPGPAVCSLQPRQRVAQRAPPTCNCSCVFVPATCIGPLAPLSELARSNDCAPAAANRGTTDASAGMKLLPAARRCADRQRTGSPSEQCQRATSTARRWSTRRPGFAAMTHSATCKRHLTFDMSGNRRLAGGCPLDGGVSSGGGKHATQLSSPKTRS